MSYDKILSYANLKITAVRNVLPEAGDSARGIEPATYFYDFGYLELTFLH